MTAPRKSDLTDKPAKDVEVVKRDEPKRNAPKPDAPVPHVTSTEAAKDRAEAKVAKGEPSSPGGAEGIDDTPPVTTNADGSVSFNDK